MTSGPVAQWITRLPTEQKIPGSSPGRFDTIFVVKVKKRIFQSRLFQTLIDHLINYSDGTI